VDDSTDAARNHVLEAAAIVLDVHSVGMEDNFFDLGGTSIGAIELCAELERLTGFEVPLEMVWDTDSFAALARAVAPLLAGSTSIGRTTPGTAGHAGPGNTTVDGQPAGASVVGANLA
jgi:acyl carrier protein